ncbi:putative two-component system response regulator [Nocardia nova SH22a]|uniref:Putative two-component system response regulator n=1 Tax=Nocardia nova SH22a TaxID=1415166 RepID=W5THV7_9NOCA|nr:response regulator transcription factor [Nocardia nova]AHH18817.1 putative two-component system response regulator [Nocardia nova SH22a]
MIRVILAEDEHLTRSAVATLLGMEADLLIVGQAATGDEALEVIRIHRPDIAVLDIEMPGLDGAQVAERVAADHPGTRCVLLTRHARPGVLRRALAAKAMGFVTKNTPAATLAEVIRNVHTGARYIDPELAATALDNADCPLTDRELDVLRHVDNATTSDEIAAAVHLSPGTVRNYLSSAMGKLQARNRIEASARARDRGWL